MIFFLYSCQEKPKTCEKVKELYSYLDTLNCYCNDEKENVQQLDTTIFLLSRATGISSNRLADIYRKEECHKDYQNWKKWLDKNKLILSDSIIENNIISNDIAFSKENNLQVFIKRWNIHKKELLSINENLRKIKSKNIRDSLIISFINDNKGCYNITIMNDYIKYDFYSSSYFVKYGFYYFRKNMSNLDSNLFFKLSEKKWFLFREFKKKQSHIQMRMQKSSKLF